MSLFVHMALHCLSKLYLHLVFSLKDMPENSPILKTNQQFQMISYTLLAHSERH